MKNKYTVLMVLILLTGCAWDTTVDVAVGQVVGTDYRDANQETTASITVKQESESGWYVAYTHVSRLFKGAPFNNDHEVWQDEVRVGKKFVIRKGAPK